MSEYNYQKEINEAIQAADNALYYLNNANQYLSSAGNWGIVDILGGGLISTFAKHSKMDKAQQELQQAKYAVQAFKKELQDVGQISDIDINAGDFLTFADFFFDGFVADWLVQSKIRDAQRQINDAVKHINYIKNQLLNYR
ncbi:MAG: hypothetical protein ACLUFN_00390 [Eubacterium sp.]